MIGAAQLSCYGKMAIAALMKVHLVIWVSKTMLIWSTISRLIEYRDALERVNITILSSYIVRQNNVGLCESSIVYL